MASNPIASASSHPTYVEIVSAVPPVPPEVRSKVAETPYGMRNPQWITEWSGEGYPVPQVITALVLIEESPAGKEWGVQLAEIPSNTRPSDTRYSQSCGGTLDEAFGCVEWFFKRSKLSETASMATVAWVKPGVITRFPGMTFSCNAVQRMLYAAQELELQHRMSKDKKLAAMENEISSLEARIATLESQKSAQELQDVIVKDNVDTRLAAMENKISSLETALKSQQSTHVTPTVTCLMHLFAGHTDFTCVDDDPLAIDRDTDSTPDSTPTKGFSVSADGSPSTVRPTFNIAPHTDRLSDLSPDAQRWFLKQLDTRNVWVRATDPDSIDNHISWAPFKGAVEMGQSVAFSHGNHRFW